MIKIDCHRGDVQKQIELHRTRCSARNWLEKIHKKSISATLYRRPKRPIVSQPECNAGTNFTVKKPIGLSCFFCAREDCNATPQNFDTRKVLRKNRLKAKKVKHSESFKGSFS